MSKAKKDSPKFKACVQQTVEVFVPLKAQTLADAVLEAEDLKNHEVYETCFDVVDYVDLKVSGVWREG